MKWEAIIDTPKLCEKLPKLHDISVVAFLWDQTTKDKLTFVVTFCWMYFFVSRCQNWNHFFATFVVWQFLCTTAPSVFLGAYQDDSKLATEWKQQKRNYLRPSLRSLHRNCSTVLHCNHTKAEKRRRAHTWLIIHASDKRATSYVLCITSCLCLAIHYCVQRQLYSCLMSTLCVIRDSGRAGMYQTTTQG